MDNSILKKRLSTFKTATGKLTRISDDVLFDVIRVWEAWPGKSKDLARELGINGKQMGFLVKKAKQLNRDGLMPNEGFKEIKLEAGPIAMVGSIELSWDNNKVIRFSQVELLVDFLKKVA